MYLTLELDSLWTHGVEGTPEIEQLLTHYLRSKLAKRGCLKISLIQSEITNYVNPSRMKIFIFYHIYEYYNYHEIFLELKVKYILCIYTNTLIRIFLL